MTETFTDVNYEVCECGINFTSVEELQEHISNYHAKSITADDGDAIYLLQVETTNNNDCIRIHKADESYVVESVKELSEIPIDSNDFFQEVDACSQLSDHEEINSGIVQIVKEIKEKRNVEEATLTNVHNLSRVNEIILNCNLNSKICNNETEVIEKSQTNATLNDSSNPGSTHLQLRICELCTQSFITKRAYQMHYRKVHQKIKKKYRKYQYSNIMDKVCDICGRGFSSNAALSYHQRIHTGEKPYECPLCDKTFTMLFRLQIHVRTHTGERPFECQFCPKAFPDKHALIRHNRIHTGEKPFACPDCPRAFTQSNSLKLHIRTAHLNEPWPKKKKKTHHA